MATKEEKQKLVDILSGKDLKWKFYTYSSLVNKFCN
jgi:hypothetical protein